MTGVDIIGALLGQHGPTQAMIPADRTYAGHLPEGVGYPAFVLASVSNVPVGVVKRGAKRRWRGRVQVTAVSTAYDEIDPALRLACAACDEFFGDIAGATEVAVTLGSEGPDFTAGDEPLHLKSQDFLVSYNRVS